MKPAYPIPDSPDGDVWGWLDHFQSRGRNVALTVEQIRWLLADRARLIEKANTTMRVFWGVPDDR